MNDVPENLSAISSESEAIISTFTDPVSIYDNEFMIVKSNSALA